LAEKIWIINESVSYFNEFRPLDCFVATLLATTVPKIVPYRGKYGKNVDINQWSMRYLFCEVGLAMCHSTGSIGDTLIGPFYYPEVLTRALYGLIYKLLVINFIAI
ncbi:hypothetical protein SDA85_06620, partial [Legionella pneumophila serogroup 1]